jgi:hypothetical protein
VNRRSWFSEFWNDEVDRCICPEQRTLSLVDNGRESRAAVFGAAVAARERGPSASQEQPRWRLDPELYELLRMHVLRDGWRCQLCGTTFNLEVHHKEFRSQSGDDFR